MIGNFFFSFDNRQEHERVDQGQGSSLQLWRQVSREASAFVTSPSRDELLFVQLMQTSSLKLSAMFFPAGLIPTGRVSVPARANTTSPNYTTKVNIHFTAIGTIAFPTNAPPISRTRETINFTFADSKNKRLDSFSSKSRLT